MPGYGYAAAAKSKVAAWTALIDAFLRGRSNLAGSMSWWMRGMDSNRRTTRHSTPSAQAAVSYQVVLTKCDEVKPVDLAGRIAAVEAALAKRPAAFPTVLATSSHDGKGIPELRAAIARLLAERKG